jgi:hypothetical protein
MKTTYINQAGTRGRRFPSHLSLGWSKDFYEFGQSHEAVAVKEGLKNIADLIVWYQKSESAPALDVLTYGHIGLKPAFSVKCRYKYIGELPPRQFPIDDE